ncbi:MAG: DUF5329 family protein [Candidatus Omnitrophica bacterium]|nr:DUF5329 family protein [Candidatus Omnitrophota bacterium]
MKKIPKLALVLLLLSAAFGASGFLRARTVTPEDVYFCPKNETRTSPVYSKMTEVLENPGALERLKIDFLIEKIKKSPYSFIRNGVPYNGPRSSAHLVWKYRRKVARIVTAHDFINNIATRSSISGELYLVRLKDGRTYPMRDVLLNELRRLEESLKEDAVSTDKK